MNVCPICQSRGQVLYEKLKDRMHGTPGSWGIKKCCGHDCGLLWIDPKPSEQILRGAYDDYFTTHARVTHGFIDRAKQAVSRCFLALRFGYRRGIHPFMIPAGLVVYLHPGERQQIEASVMHLPASGRGKLLEIGFGNGSRLAMLSSLGWDVEGIEVDRRAVENVRSRLGLPVKQSGLADADYPDGHFDRVIMSHVLEHVVEPVSLLKEVARVLKPWGEVVISTPNSNSLNHRKFGASYFHLDPPRHLFVFNKMSLANAAETTGLEVVRLWLSTRNHISTAFASSEIRKTGHFRWHAKPRLGMRPTSLIIHWAAWIGALFDKELGDELFLIARKLGPMTQDSSQRMRG